MSCTLTIEIDAPETARSNGATVSGVVIVNNTKPVSCRGLEVTSYWSTHGRGNVDMGDVDQSMVFEGEWEANREYRYPFSLKTATWPPTYYGTYLNVSHFVRARAKVPWSSDPKATAEFTVVANSAPEDLKPTTKESPKSNSILGWVIGGLILLVVGTLFGAILLVLLPLAGIAWGCYWFFRVFLPRQITGAIESSFEPQRLGAGETIQGQMKFTPKRNARINGISWSLSCVEKCVSGSGTKKTTHRHEILRKTERLAEAGLLRAGLTQSFHFLCPIPETAAPSLKFSDNELIWEGELRIDIPRWPDWVKTFPLTVVPSKNSLAASTARTGSVEDDQFDELAALTSTTPLPQPEQASWFDEVVQQVLQSRRDPERMQMILAAVQGQVFSLRVEILERLMEPPRSTPGETGTWIRAYDRARDLSLCLLDAGRGNRPVPNIGEWIGLAAVIGFDGDLDCLLMRIV